MTSWLKIPPTIVILTLVLHPLVFMSGYLLLEKKREKFRKESFLSMDNKKLEKAEYLTIKSKFRLSLQFLPQTLQIVFAFVSNDIVVSGVVTSIVFKSSPFSPEDHYKYYMIASFGGLCLGRSYLGLTELIKPSWTQNIQIRKTWILVALTIAHVIVFVLASLYRFLPNVWITMSLVFSLGFLSEATYVNISVALGELEDYRTREFALGMSVYGIGLGNLIGSLLSQYIEVPLVLHCFRTIAEKKLCFTRKI